MEDNINVFQVSNKLLRSVKRASLEIVIFIGTISFILHDERLVGTNQKLHESDWPSYHKKLTAFWGLNYLNRM